MGARGRFFGDQRAKLNYLNQEQLETDYQELFLTHLDTAFSRDQQKKVYVQDRMEEKAAELYKWSGRIRRLFLRGVHSTNVESKRLVMDARLAVERPTMTNCTPAVFHTRKKADGSGDSLCLGCFRTISLFESKALEDRDEDHMCAFMFPDRRATEEALDNGLRRRASDQLWQMLISSQDAMGVAA